MTEQKKNFPDFYLTASQPCPYLPGRKERKLFTHLTPDKGRGFVEGLLTGGFRRSQNVAYLPYCGDCKACVSVRILIDEFEPKRSMKRIWKLNQDLVATRIEPQCSGEQYALFRSYIQARHNDGGMADMTMVDYAAMIEDSVVDTFITEYRLRRGLDEEATPGDLLGVCLCDLFTDGISMVYSYFSPDVNARSLGSYMILEHIEYARKLGRPYLYLGYWIDGCEKMSYKTRFQPQQHLTDQGWRRFPR